MARTVNQVQEATAGHRPLNGALAGEFVGTYLLVLIGTGVVAAAVLSSAQVGLWQGAVVWGFGVTLAIYATAGVSGAHLNPAISLAFALFRAGEFPAIAISDLSRKMPLICIRCTSSESISSTSSG